MIRRRQYAITFDTAFPLVIQGCAQTPRGDELGSWIHPEIANAYQRLHELGYAHSVEAWEEGELVGGLYGVELGRCFFGESMFALRPNASKVALAALVDLLRTHETSFIDCQVTSSHLLSLGACEVPRSEFLLRLNAALAFPRTPARWPPQPPGHEP